VEAVSPVAQALSALPGVDPRLLKERALLKRFDVKMLLDASVLPQLLAQLAGDYGVLSAGSTRLASYRTLYFDTPDLRFYRDHARGRATRHKVRIRHYPERQVAFLETKTRCNHGTTDKKRLEVPFGQCTLDEEGRALVLDSTGILAGALTPVAWTNFTRITLVGLHTAERVTLDLNLNLTCGERSQRFERLLIAEVKQPHINPRTPAMLALRRCDGRKGSMSKYAVAIALLAGGVPRNRLLPTLRRIERIEECSTSLASIRSTIPLTSGAWSPG
jgi:hypothetical protein